MLCIYYYTIKIVDGTGNIGYVYVIALEGVKSGINFTSCSENGNQIARGAAECYFAVIATTSGIYPKISLLIASFFKVNTSDFQTRFHNVCGILLLPASHDGSGLTLTQYPAEY